MLWGDGGAVWRGADGGGDENADAGGEKVEGGLNGVFGRSEVSGHAYGIGSMIHTRIGIDAEVDEWGIIQGTPTGTPMSANADHEFKMAMFNNGLDNGRRFLMMAVHSDDDIATTLEPFEKSLKQFRDQGMI